jgi:hypothetical protein
MRDRCATPARLVAQRGSTRDAGRRVGRALGRGAADHVPAVRRGSDQEPDRAGVVAEHARVIVELAGQEEIDPAATRWTTGGRFVVRVR